MLTVTVYRGNKGDIHTSKVFSGLSSLAAQRRIKLQFSWRTPPQLSDCKILDRFIVWLRVNNESSSPLYLCFDMRDSGYIPHLELLQQCDAYFKRSFRTASVVTIDETLRHKIKPFGLNFECVNHYPKYDFRLRLSYVVSQQSSPAVKCKLVLRFLRNRFLGIADSTKVRSEFSFPPLTERVSNLITLVDEPTSILFLTRTWSSTKIGLSLSQLDEINNFRASTIRALRKAFGSAVGAGFADNDYARKHYPDCIASQPTDKESYTALLDSCIIAVQTVGLYGSTGWKLGEYLAAGKCIVSEPINDLLPAQLEEDKHLLTFTTPEQCVTACHRLTEDKVLARQMSNNNSDYYLAEVEPAAQVYRCLVEASSSVAHEQRCSTAHT